MSLPQLRRVRWAVRATLALGVAASVTANILHAQPHPISQAIAAWPPLALLLTIELISRVPVHHRGLAVARLAATTIIAGIAAWVSYWHMVGVAARYGETGASPYLLPLSVDGLIIVASVCLVELAGRIRRLETAPAGERTAAGDAVASPSTDGHATANGQPTAGRQAATNAQAAANGRAATSGRSGAASRGAKKSASSSRSPRTSRPRRPVAETVALAAAIEAESPDITPEELAQRLGITTRRLREVRREARELQITA